MDIISRDGYNISMDIISRDGYNIAILYIMEITLSKLNDCIIFVIRSNNNITRFIYNNNNILLISRLLMHGNIHKYYYVNYKTKKMNVYSSYNYLNNNYHTVVNYDNDNSYLNKSKIINLNNKYILTLKYNIDDVAHNYIIYYILKFIYNICNKYSTYNKNYSKIYNEIYSRKLINSNNTIKYLLKYSKGNMYYKNFCYLY